MSVNISISEDVTLGGTIGLDAGSNLIGQVELSDGTNVIGTTAHPVVVDGSSVTQPISGTVNIGNFPAIQAVKLAPQSSGGLETYSGSIGATVTSIKGSAGQLFGWYIGNNNGTAIYVQIFDVASGSITLGTTAPKLSFMIPAGGAANVLHETGIQFSTAISFACTTTRAGNTASANTVDVNFFYV